MSNNSVSGVSYSLLLASMSVAAFFTVTAVMMPGPLLVDMAAGLDTTVPLVGQLVAITAAAWAITAVAVGPFSDTYGRRPVLLLGVCLLGLGSLGVGLAPNYTLVTGFSALLGVGGGMVPATCIALIGDTFPATRLAKSIAILTTMPGVSSVVGVPVSAVLGGIAGWRFPFLAVGLALLLTTLLLFWLVPRHKPQNTTLDVVGRLSRVASLPVTWHVVGTNILARMTWGVIMTFFPAFLIVSYGLGTAEVALPVAVVSLGTTAAPLLAGKIARKRNRFSITAAMLLMGTIPGLSLFLVLGGTWVSVVAAGSFMLLIVPVTTVLSILFAETGGAYRGTLAGVVSSTNWGGTAAGAAIGGVLVAQIGYGALSILLAGAILVSGLLMLFLVNETAISNARKHFSASLDRVKKKRDR